MVHPVPAEVPDRHVTRHSGPGVWCPHSWRAAVQANEVLFVDSEHEDEVLTFREVFLGSRALELLLAGFIAEPPSSDEEHALLASLLGSTLGGDSALHQVAIAQQDALNHACCCRSHGLATTSEQTPSLHHMAAWPFVTLQGHGTALLWARACCSL
jgi:hypothetical protein